MKSSPVRGSTIRALAPAAPAFALAVTLALASAGAAQAAAPLPALNIDKTKITVSGLSSGGFMANQLGYAHSSIFKGVGVFAGGPYMCAGHSNYTACMYNATIPASALSTMQADLNNWSGTAIDAKSNVAAQKVYLFVGTSDAKADRPADTPLTPADLHATVLSAIGLTSEQISGLGLAPVGRVIEELF